MLLLLLLSCFSRVRLCATPQMAAHQAPSSLGFSRQEHWSGLPFPSPMQESESESEVAQSCPTLRDPWTAAHQAPPSMGFSRQEYWSGVPLPSPTEYYSATKKEWSNAIYSNMNESRDYRTKQVSHKGKDKCHMVSLVCGIQIWHKWAYLRNRKRLTNIEKRRGCQGGGQ